MSQRGVEFGVTDLRQALARGPADAEGGEAALRGAAMAAEMLEETSENRSLSWGG
jgi:hypothetical protein